MPRPQRLAALFVVTLSMVATALAQVPAGGELQVASPASYSIPTVAAGRSGDFVVIWDEYDQTSYTIKGQRFDRHGARQGAEFMVAANGAFPVAAAFADGRFVVTWTDASGQSGSVFDPAGLRVGAEFRLGQSVQNPWRADVAILSGRSFVVAWTGRPDLPSDVVYARIYDAAGNPLTADFVVSTYTTFSTGDYGPSVAAGADGGFVVVWTSRQVPPGPGIFGRRYDATGTLVGSEFMVSAYSTDSDDYAHVARDGRGNFVATWQRHPFGASSVLLGRRFAATGLPAGPEFVVANFTQSFLVGYPTSIVADASGAFTITWSGLDDGDDDGVMARRYDSAGAPRGAAFQVNTTTTEAQRHPEVANDGAGNLIVAWLSVSGSPPWIVPIRAQRYGGLQPVSLSLVDNDNTVLEVGEAFGAATAWRNVSGTSQTFQGRSSELSAPAGLSLSLPSGANYGTVSDGAVGTCVSCFAGTLSGTRPAGHVDVSWLETVVPDALGQTQRWTLHVGGSFGDVPRSSAFYRFVETILHRGVSAGCSTGYCPLDSVTREQMAPFVLAAKEGAGYVPKACGTPQFADVPAVSPFCRWIEELARRGVTGGCSGGNYCPHDAVTRAQMAVFLLHTLDPALSPPACTTPVFGDVPASSPFCRWIEELVRRGVTAGCGGGNYCPAQPVTREQMAVFLTTTFGLTLYGP